MRRTLALSICVLGIAAATASAQAPDRFATDPFARETPAEPTPETPDTATATAPSERYESYAPEMGPRELLQQKAMFRAQQRRNRIATMRWFGMSNSRPIASSIPHMGVYSPRWIGNSSQAFHWTGSSFYR